MATEIEWAKLAALLVGEGHFGGDGRQPQVTLRMHVRHRTLFAWLVRTFPGGRLYGPYAHGGREYFQWMARGSFLREEVVPALRRHLTPTFDDYACERFEAMCRQYPSRLGDIHGSSGVSPSGAT